MPIDVVCVEAVDTFRGSSFWEVTGTTARGEFLRFTTNSSFKAALCLRSKARGLRVVIGWMDSRHYGRNIISVALEEESVHVG